MGRCLAMPHGLAMPHALVGWRGGTPQSETSERRTQHQSATCHNCLRHFSPGAVPGKGDSPSEPCVLTRHSWSPPCCCSMRVRGVPETTVVGAGAAAGSCSHSQRRSCLPPRGPAGRDRLSGALAPCGRAGQPALSGCHARPPILLGSLKGITCQGCVRCRGRPRRRMCGGRRVRRPCHQPLQEMHG